LHQKLRNRELQKHSATKRWILQPLLQSGTQVKGGVLHRRRR
jgi:hypothetical protein